MKPHVWCLKSATKCCLCGTECYRVTLLGLFAESIVCSDDVALLEV